MRKLLQISGLSLGLILVLSITIRQRTLFNHIYSVISPMTIAAQNATERFFAKSVDSTKSYSKKLFQNSVPAMRDTVKSKAAGLKRSFENSNEEKPAEEITPAEKQELDSLIRSHR